MYKNYIKIHLCKSWLSLIKSSQFINTHLSHPNNTKYLFFEHFGSCDGLSLYSDSEPYVKCSTLALPNKLPYIHIHSCCNGVICYRWLPTPQIVYLWNPSIRKLKVLPKFRRSFAETYAIGFWFNAEKNDYEVVKIAYTRETSFVEVYSLSSNSWKMINQTCPGARHIYNYMVYVKGTLHWLAEQEHGCLMVSLDMKNEKLREKFVSDSCGRTVFVLTRAHADFLAIFRCRDGCTVEVYDENLTMFSQDLNVDGGKYLFPLGLRNNGEAVLVKRSDSKPDNILSYDFATKELKDLGFVGRCPYLFTTFPFVESLVLLNDSDVQTTTSPFEYAVPEYYLKIYLKIYL